MKTRISLTNIVLCLALVLCALLVNAQGGSAFEQQLGKAVDQINSGSWQNAEAILKGVAHNELNQSEFDRLRFTLGYFYQMRALEAIDSAAGQHYLDSATAYYLTILERNARNESLNQNLAALSRHMNNPKKAISYMRQAYRRSEKAEHALSIGDLYTQTGNYDSAFFFYKEALKKEPTREHVHRSMINLYTIRPVSANETFAHCQQMITMGFPKLSSIALANYVNRMHSFDSTASQNAFVWWMALLGRDQVADENIDRTFPVHWNFQGFTEIDTTWKNPMAAANLSWWKNDSIYKVEKTVLVRREIITGALNVLGRRLVRDGKSAEGIFIYETAYNILTNGNPYAYLDRYNHRPPDIFLDIASNLGMAYAQYPDEKTEAKFRQLEGDMFDAKGGSISSGDTEGAVKYHRTLGLIYATMGRWDNGVMGGLYQLEQAISKSPVERNTVPLKELLLKGYFKSNNLALARDLALTTAMSYLNDDNVTSAQRSLYVYDSLNGNKQISVYTQLNAIVEMRKKIAGGISLTSETTKRLMADIDTLTTAKSRLPDYFFKIQRFKMLSDAGTMAQQSSDEKAAEFFHLRALEQAQSIESLSNLKDVSRLNEQQKTLEKSVKFQNAPRKLVPQNEQGQLTKETKRWYVNIPGTARKQQVEMPESNFTAVKVLGMVNNEETPETRVEVINAEGKDAIVVPVQNNDPELKRAIRKAVSQDQTPVILQRRNYRQ